jgi:Ca2+-binding EF-hand superfamily protein
LVEQITPVMLASTLDNLMDFTAVDNKLKQAVCVFISSQLLTKEDKIILDKVFKVFDKDAKGSLTEDEMRLALRQYASIEPTEHELDSIFEHLDISGSGYIEYSVSGSFQGILLCDLSQLFSHLLQSY